MNKENNKNYDANFKIDNDGDYVKELNLNILKPSSVSISALHFITDSAIEIAISSLKDKNKLISGSEEKIMLYNDEILNNESLSINLIPGEYIIYVAFKGYYLENLSENSLLEKKKNGQKLNKNLQKMVIEGYEEIAAFV